MFTLVRLLVRFIGILLAVIGILLVGGETRKLLLASIYKHAGEPSETPGRHATDIDAVPLPTLNNRRPVDDAARYEDMYQRQENSWIAP
jgi:hypothetical protein